MPGMEKIFKFQNIMFVVVGIFIAGTFIYTFAMIFSPKLRGKMMSQQVKALRHMTDFSKEDLGSIIKESAGMAIRTKKQILDENGELLEEIADRETDIEARQIKKKVRAIKEGLEEDSSYCKHCGMLIDSDSKFCKRCGKEQ